MVADLHANETIVYSEQSQNDELKHAKGSKIRDQIEEDRIVSNFKVLSAKDIEELLSAKPAQVPQAKPHSDDD